MLVNYLFLKFIPELLEAEWNWKMKPPVLQKKSTSYFWWKEINELHINELVAGDIGATLKIKKYTC